MSLSISEVGVARLSTSVAHRWCRRLHDEDEGLSLVEILVASFILVVAVLGIASTAAASLRGVRVSRDRDAAATAASAAVEAARDLGFDDLALATGNDFSSDPNVVAGEFSHDGVASEALVLSSAGVAPYRCTATTTTCFFPFQEYGNLDSAALYVTAFDDDPTVDVDGDGDATNDVDAKRATVEITWTDVTNVRTVRQSTIIAASKRGLGLPEFQVSPLTAGGLVKPNDAICLEHEIFNAGAADSYDLSFETPVDGSVDETPTDRVKLNTKPGNAGPHSWQARAWFGPNAAADMQAWLTDWRDDGTATETDGSRLRESGDGDNRLETQYTLPRDTSEKLFLCYTHGSEVATDQPTVLFKPIVRSQLGLVVGEEKTTTLEHTIRVGTVVSGLYLSRATNTDGATTVGQFQSTVPDATPLPDYDGEGIPGRRLLKPANNGGVAGRFVWAKPHDTDGTVKFTKATLRLWTNWDDAIQFGTTPSKKTLSFNVRVCIVATSETSCGTNGQVQSITYEHASAGWCDHGRSTECPTALSLTFPAEQSVGSGQHLLLQITCTSGSTDKEDDCHLAYGTETFPARLELT